VPPQRTPGRIEVETAQATPPPEATEASGKIAAVIVKRAPAALRLAAGPGLRDDLEGTGLPPAEIERWLDAFARAGWVRLGYRLRGGERALDRVTVRDPVSLEEHADPGSRRARGSTPADVRRELAALDHPVAERIARLIEEKPVLGNAPRLLDGFLAVARHVAAGGVMAPQTFSAQHLGDAQQLGRMRFLLEGLLGPLAQLGIREGGELVHLGGTGRVRLGSSGRAMLVDLERVPPCIAIGPDAFARGRALEPADGGLLLVEGFPCFEAACRGEAGLPEPATVLWTAGYPGRGVRRLVEEAAEAGARVRVWADLDLDGVRIARLVARWAGSAFEPWRMAPADLAAAAARTPLTPGAAEAIRADLAREPGALLADTLAAILEANSIVDQEQILAGGG
jgi:hypothetical protein